MGTMPVFSRRVPVSCVFSRGGNENQDFYSLSSIIHKTSVFIVHRRRHRHLALTHRTPCTQTQNTIPHTRTQPHVNETDNHTHHTHKHYATSASNRYHLTVTPPHSCVFHKNELHTKEWFEGKTRRDAGRSLTKHDMKLNRYFTSAYLVFDIFGMPRQLPAIHAVTNCVVTVIRGRGAVTVCLPH